MNIKILIATHKEYYMPKDSCYLPVQVGKEGKQCIGYVGDNTGENISKKNPYYCELTGMYWGWKNVNCDYIGLVHYRRHFSNKKFFYRILHNRFKSILKDNELEALLRKYDVILPKKRRYFIETLYSHYAHTHYSEHLDEVRRIISERCKQYIEDFDFIMNRTDAHMFNMFVMKKDLADKYCEWLFPILGKLEERIDIANYDSYQARFYGRVSELLINVWIRHNQIEYKEIPFIYTEKINWMNKVISFLKAKIIKKKFDKSF